METREVIEARMKLLNEYVTYLLRHTRFKFNHENTEISAGDINDMIISASSMGFVPVGVKRFNYVYKITRDICDMHNIGYKFYHDDQLVHVTYPDCTYWNILSIKMHHCHTRDCLSYITALYVIQTKMTL